MGFEENVKTQQNIFQMNLILNRSMLNRIKGHPQYYKALQWGKLITITGSAQIIVQGVGFASGLLIIHLLPIHEYALYTLSNTMLGTMTLLADGGIGTGVLSQGGKVWQDKEKLGVILATGLNLRRKFALGSLLFAIPILIYLLLRNDADWITAILIVVSLIPAFFAALSDSLLEIFPKLHQDILPLQKNQISVGIGRLVLTGLTIFIFPWTFVAVLAGGIPRIYGNIKLRKIAENFVDNKQIPDPIIEKEILTVVKRVLPGAIYYCLSGQITVWLISIFGNATSVAQVGALGRVSVLLGLFATIFSTLLVPRFARQKNEYKVLLNQFLSNILILIVICLFVVLGISLFSTQFLWILGGNYRGLDAALVLNVIGSCLGLMTGLLFSLSSSRGWLINPYIYIITNLLCIVIGIFLFDVSSLIGVLRFNIFISVIQTLIYSFYTLFKIRQLKSI
ncbi:MATE family efflux transporter [Flavobacterium aquicola]|uniref:O-antigen/teichoic acid export membrane protein n=1 Tax=Flavobacterium aquicola TaxID=1682742 RepID=A0A3E0EUP6_9FLAO|nr:polysaccharide biosynthesis protein [Flavobacterium aquicola]REH01888.1 O-antigen/teichoic acid export membrane protein [Flavobacterium aquicola]